MSSENHPDSPPSFGNALLTINEVASKLHTSRDSVERLIAQGSLRAFNISPRGRAGRRPNWRVASGDLDTFLEGRANRAAPAPAARKQHRSNMVTFIE